MVEAELGCPVKVRVGGPLMMRFLGLFNKEMNETAEMLFEWMQPYVVDSSKAEKTFGLQATPYKEAIRDTVKWCQEVAVSKK